MTRCSLACRVRGLVYERSADWIPGESPIIAPPISRQIGLTQKKLLHVTLYLRLFLFIIFCCRKIKKLPLPGTLGTEFIGCFLRQYHLQNPLQNKLQATEHYVNHSSWYLFHSMRCKTGDQPWYFQNSKAYEISRFICVFNQNNRNKQRQFGWCGIQTNDIQCSTTDGTNPC